MPAKKYSYERLFSFTVNIFKKIGCNEADAHTAAISLLRADIRGVDSHGIARLIGYVRLKDAGRANTAPSLRIIHESPSTAVVDADAALGLVSAPFAMKIAIEKAGKAGTGWVSVCNSNHFGIAGHHAMMAVENDMIGIAFTNASPTVAPTFSSERLLGTNPICVAVPAGEEPAFVADLATTTAANGKLEILQRKGENTPEGWVQDKDGNSTTDPHILKHGGALLPLGGDYEHSSHKGYALGSVVDIFSAILSGANFGPWVPPFPAYLPMPAQMPGKGIGHFFGAMRIDAFRPAQEFRNDMDMWLRRFRGAKPVKGRDAVLVPGDPERLMEKERMEHGIPIHDAVIQDLQSLSERFDIPL